MNTNGAVQQAANRLRRPALMLAIITLLVSVGQPLGMAAHKAEAARASRPVVCNQSLAVTEGPFWRAGSPERTSLIEPGMVGVRVLVTGYVYDTNCQPVPNAWLDF